MRASNAGGHGGNTSGPEATQLGDHGVDAIQLLHIQGLWGVLLVDSVAVEEEAVGTLLSTHAGAVSVHELLQLGGLFDLELDLVAFRVANLGRRASEREMKNR